MNKYIPAILASAMLTSTGLSQGNKLDSVTVNRLADVIFRCENSQHHPYGVMISTKDPRKICINTINHAWVDFEREHKPSKSSQPMTSAMTASSLPFISFLGQRYCPPSVDKVGYHNWTNNVFRILHAR